MAWFRNHYKCDRCGSNWTDEWSCMCDDDCPECGSRHYSPYHSDDLTDVVVRCGRQYLALRSPETAEHFAKYEELGRFKTKKEARAHLAQISREDA